MTQNEHKLAEAVPALLDAVERGEEPLLSWGVVDVGVDEHAVEALAKQVLTQLGSDLTVDDLLDGAERLGALFFDDVDDTVRSRSAETVRLLARLRQLVPGQGEPPHWSTRPALVRDFRFERRARTRPKRNRPAVEVISALRGTLTPLGRDALHALLKTPNGNELEISGFQERSIYEVLGAVASPNPSAVMISAGTGAGKTKAFYLPAFAHLAGLVRDSRRWTKAISIYPRNELLKDQFTEAFAQARLLDDLMVRETGRKLVLGAYYGDVPYSKNSTLRRSWRRSGNGFVCPFLRCPACAGDMVRQPDRPDQLECRCGFIAGPDVLLLDRQAMADTPPDIVFVSGEMLNRSLSHRRHSRIVGVGAERPPQMVLLDEVHTYGGASGAQTGLMLRRWAHAASSRPAYVGLSATLRDPQSFLSQVTGVPRAEVAAIAPHEEELEVQGREYLLALRNDAAAGTAVLSTTIQTCMLLTRCLDIPGEDHSLFGSKLFAFTDNLDVANRLYSNLCDAEGRFIWDKPIPNQESLATLRHPGLSNGSDRLPRHHAGQSWSLPLELGHDLSPGSSIRLGRVHSKDAGVDQWAQVVVATASLEVGFDDPEVGAIVQHGAPRDVAQFLQRQGRAGRDVSMRPWTVVVLSEYGRDRIAYQGWDLLFDPELPPKHLPVRNRYLLRMHASACLIDWIGFELGSTLSRNADLWRLLAGPAEQGKYYKANRDDQKAVLHLLVRLLEEPDVQQRFAAYVAGALHLEAMQVDELLWYPPRSVLLTAVPSLIRRLETEWRNEPPRPTADGNDPPTPLPEHMSANLFSALELPELDVVAERKSGDFTFEESLPFDRSMREFCPGNVSRRAATADQVASHWVPVPDLNSDEVQVLEPATHYTEVQPIGLVDLECEAVNCTGTCARQTHEVPVLRPASVRIERTPAGLNPSSRAFPLWHSTLTPSGRERPVSLPDDVSGVHGLDFHLHADGSHLDSLRVVYGADGSALLRGEERRYRVRFAQDGSPVVLGVRATVDGCRVLLDVPREYASVADLPSPLLRAVRAAWVRHRFEMDLDEYVNKFKAMWLHDAAIAAIAVEVQDGDHPGPKAAFEAIAHSLPAHMLASLDVLFERVDDDIELAGGPRRVRDGLAALMQQADVTDQIAQTIQELWNPLGPEAEDWLHHRLVHTYGVAVLRAAQQVCRDHDPDSVILDTLHDGDTTELWLVETTPGGAGFLEALARRVGDDPRVFEREVRRALSPSDAADIGEVMAACLPDLIGGGDLATTAQAFRKAGSGQEKLSALSDLRSRLERRGLPVTHSTVSALTARVLRPGTDVSTDNLVLQLLTTRDLFEDRVGVEVDNRVWSFIASADRSYDGLGGIAGRSGRLDAIESVLWRRGWEAEADGLSAWSPYINLLPSAPDVLRHRLDQATTLVDAASATALPDLLEELRQAGVAQLVADASDPADAARVLSRLMAETVDLDILRARPRLSTAERRGSALRVTIELPEVV